MEYLTSFIGFITTQTSLLLGYLGVLIMMYGCFKAICNFIYQIRKNLLHIELLRLELGQYLALGLEFLIGKDIIQTVINPTWNDLGKLGTIIILRTFLNFYLTKDIEKLEHNESLQHIVLKRKRLE